MAHTCSLASEATKSTRAPQTSASYFPMGQIRPNTIQRLRVDRSNGDLDKQGKINRFYISLAHV